MSELQECVERGCGMGGDGGGEQQGGQGFGGVGGPEGVDVGFVEGFQEAGAAQDLCFQVGDGRVRGRCDRQSRQRIGGVGEAGVERVDIRLGDEEFGAVTGRAGEEFGGEGSGGGGCAVAGEREA
ncbi:hypothetical protein BJF79_31190 [Actinomadura sp. CNU-125]|uniref:hypothetical protein n=1 Tax=Actinomadura sp. CNU-125 TaxID=1904961 RepID=UPI00095EF0B6|nr:hypothetical protein [Actinomadura sp. CNU-125]OLT36344.1 hypothetical protein BJF79_31190 [Actinomadura sp. CNU-125]